MSVEENKKSLTRCFEEVWNKGNYSLIPEFISPDYIYTNGGDKGLEGFEQFVKNARTTFPDLHYTVDEMIGEGDTLAVRLTRTGTFLGKMGDIEPTGKSINLTHVLISRFADGKCIETTSFHDMLDFSQQLGITG
jgi:predicted ester cyclase